MQAHPVIKMKGSKRSNVVSKMAGTMGRALVTPLNIATGKPGSAKSQLLVSSSHHESATHFGFSHVCLVLYL